MLRSFLSESNNLLAHATLIQESPPIPDREPVKVLIVGSREGVLRIIHTLHCLNFADAGEWSRLLPTGNPAEVMAILIRQVLRE